MEDGIPELVCIGGRFMGVAEVLRRLTGTSLWGVAALGGVTARGGVGAFWGISGGEEGSILGALSSWDISCTCSGFPSSWSPIAV